MELICKRIHTVINGTFNVIKYCRYVNVILCECLLCPGCKITQLGREYMGTMTTTTHGYTCRPWSEGSPYDDARDDSNFPDGSVAAAKNYCRNPDSDPHGPWCHTTDPNKSYDFCPVPFCSGRCIYLLVNGHM